MKRRVGTTNADIAEIFNIAMRPSGLDSTPPKFQATASRRQLAVFLESLGEDEVAKRISSLTDDAMQQIFQRAAINFENKNGYVRALCLAAVELIEGQPRALARKRRKNAT